MTKQFPVQCDDCKRFVGKDGYIDAAWTECGYELASATCGPCGRAKGLPDKRKEESQ